MEVREALLARRSVRKFTQEPVRRENIEALMEAAMSGPSACNRRPWSFYVVTGAEKLAQLRSASRFTTKIHGTLAIVVCGELSRALPLHLKDYWIQDCCAATENILLRATDLGLGAVWCGVHPQEKAVKKVSEILELSSKQIPLNIIFLGHPAETPEKRTQYDPDCVHYL